jgi:ribose 5-phosphate isomerase B
MVFSRIYIASDHGGFALKSHLYGLLKNLGIDAIDLGTGSEVPPVDYADYAQELARKAVSQIGFGGVLICRSGIGMSIAVNRFKGIRGALCLNPDMVVSAREHNDANVLCLGSSYVSRETSKECLSAFVNTKFSGGRHLRRVNKIDNI